MNAPTCSMPMCGKTMQTFPDSTIRFCPRCDRRDCKHCPDPVAEFHGTTCPAHKENQ